MMRGTRGRSPLSGRLGLIIAAQLCGRCEVSDQVARGRSCFDGVCDTLSTSSTTSLPPLPSPSVGAALCSCGDISVSGGLQSEGPIATNRALAVSGSVEGLGLVAGSVRTGSSVRIETNGVVAGEVAVDGPLWVGGNFFVGGRLNAEDVVVQGLFQQPANQPRSTDSFSAGMTRAAPVPFEVPCDCDALRSQLISSLADSDGLVLAPSNGDMVLLDGSYRVVDDLRLSQLTLNALGPSELTVNGALEVDALTVLGAPVSIVVQHRVELGSLDSGGALELATPFAGTLSLPNQTGDGAARWTSPNAELSSSGFSWRGWLVVDRVAASGSVVLRVP